MHKSSIHNAVSMRALETNTESQYSNSHTYSLKMLHTQSNEIHRHLPANKKPSYVNTDNEILDDTEAIRIVNYSKHAN